MSSKTFKTTIVREGSACFIPFAKIREFLTRYRVLDAPKAPSTGGQGQR